MNTTYIFVSLFFSLLALVLAWFWVQGDGNRPLKLLLTAIVVASGVALAFSLKSYGGYPSDQTIPEQSLLKGAVILEPVANRPGAIYVWVQSPPRQAPFWAVFLRQTTPGEPRAYALPYSKESHKEIAEAAELAKLGFHVKIGGKGKGKVGAGKGSGGDGEGNGSDGGAANGNGQKGRKTLDSEGKIKELQITVEPPDDLMRKGD